MRYLIFLLCFLVGNSFAMSKTIYGYVEKVELLDVKASLSAKLDTGAKTASLSAVDISKFEKNGEEYVKFAIPLKSGKIELIKKLLGEVKIKARAGEHLKNFMVSRPLIEMNIRLQEQTRKIKVNLTNRSRFLYPLLLGREAIVKFNAVIDPAIKYKKASNV